MADSAKFSGDSTSQPEKKTMDVMIKFLALNSVLKQQAEEDKKKKEEPKPADNFATNMMTAPNCNQPKFVDNFDKYPYNPRFPPSFDYNRDPEFLQRYSGYNLNPISNGTNDCASPMIPEWNSKRRPRDLDTLSGLKDMRKSLTVLDEMRKSFSLPHPESEIAFNAQRKIMEELIRQKNNAKNNATNTAAADAMKKVAELRKIAADIKKSTKDAQMTAANAKKAAADVKINVADEKMPAADAKKTATNAKKTAGDVKINIGDAEMTSADTKTDVKINVATMIAIANKKTTALELMKLANPGKRIIVKILKKRITLADREYSKYKSLYCILIGVLIFASSLYILFL